MSQSGVFASRAQSSSGRSTLQVSLDAVAIIVTVDICFLWLRHVVIVTGQVYKYAAGEFILSYNLDSHYVFLLLQKSRSSVVLECTPHLFFLCFYVFFCLYWAWLWVLVQSFAWKDSSQKWLIVCRMGHKAILTHLGSWRQRTAM